jgi:Xaa-Pro aminopeptidase
LATKIRRGPNSLSNDEMKKEIMKRFIFLLVFASVVSTLPALGQTDITISEVQARRAKAMQKCPDGIVLLHATVGYKHWDESGFHQDQNFYYFTELPNASAAILAIDGVAKESWLFVPPEPQGRKMGPDLTGMNRMLFAPGQVTESELGIEHVVSWDGLVAYLDGRLKSKPDLVLYLDGGGQTSGMQTLVGSNPAGLPAIASLNQAWRAVVQTKWPNATLRNAYPLLDEVRQVKSAAEVARLRKASAITAAGFWAGVHAIAPGKTQRQVEGEVVNACLQAGSEGMSLWPWVRSGPFAMGNTLFEAFADYRNMDRQMQAGEVVRLDLGCDYQMYKGDFGRTIPVSGHFDEWQREIMELLNGAYLAGVSNLRPGGTPQEVFKATVGYVEQHQNDLKTAQAKEAAASFLKQPNMPLHALGVDMADGVGKSFVPGNVLCYEPLLTAGGQAVFVEDTFLITAAGHEVLNPALPYSPKDIESAIARAHHREREMP